MLNKLKINNFALIKSLEVDFLSGFNVLLGETGAGKSIIFDAINFVLGDKADKTMIRTGEETLKVSALFTNVNDSVKKILENFDIDSSDEVLITRTYSISGKGDVKVNGEIITVSMLKQLGEVLVDSYLQNEGISLLKQKNHLQILDSYKSEDIKDVVDELNIILEKIKSLTNEINELGGNESNRERQIDLLKYQINEIQSANLIEGEDEQVNEKLVKLSNSEKILENLKNAESFLLDENGCLSLLRHSISNLKVIEKYDDNISAIVEKFEESLLNLD